MSDDPTFVYRGSSAPPVMAFREDGKVYARAASGEMVQVRITADDVERLRGCTLPMGTMDAQQMIRVLCAIIARELPSQRPS